MPAVKIDNKQTKKEPTRRTSTSASMFEFQDTFESPAEGVSSISASQPSETVFYGGIVSRSMAAAAASIAASSSSVFSSGVLPSSISSQIISSATASLYPKLPFLQESSSSGPDSLTPGINEMPDHEVVDSDPEDEFLFDGGHFNQSSSSSTSNSFEIIDDEL